MIKNINMSSVPFACFFLTVVKIILNNYTPFNLIFKTFMRVFYEQKMLTLISVEIRRNVFPFVMLEIKSLPEQVDYQLQAGQSSGLRSQVCKTFFCQLYSILKTKQQYAQRVRVPPVHKGTTNLTFFRK
jgi:hypothetical protein